MDAAVISEDLEIEDFFFLTRQSCLWTFASAESNTAQDTEVGLAARLFED